MDINSNKALREINWFTGRYEFLSNSYNCDIEYDGIKYTNAATAFIAQQCTDEGAKRKFARLAVNKARAKARNLPYNEEFEDNRLDIMRAILKAKFDQNPKLKRYLMGTKRLILVNNIGYRDEFWGVYNESGKNMLGKLLMELRDNYYKELKR